MTRVLAAVALAGCTLGRGEPFASVSPTLSASYEELADRDVGGGWQKLDSDYEVRVTRLVLEIDTIDLIDTGGAGSSFDPAHPPPGYSLCHNGHCHADDGELVSYEEIEAELAGGAGATVVVTLPVGEELELVAGVERPLACVPDCDLPLAHIGRARATLRSLTVEGAVRDGRTPARIAGEVPVTFTIALTDPAQGGAIGGTLDLPADREHDPDVSLALRISLTARLFDGLDFGTLDAAGGRIDLAAPGNEDALARLLENLAATPVETEVSR